MNDPSRFGDSPPPATTVDRHGFEVLDHVSCMRLLGASSVGRVGFSAGALPMVVPVNYVLLEGSIVFPSEGGVKSRAAQQGAVACSEADGFDGFSEGGWSVLAIGRLSEIRDPGTLERVGRFPLTTWSPEGADHFIELAIELLSGRRVARGSARTEGT